MPILGWTNIATAVLLALAIAFGFFERSGWESEIAARATDLVNAQAAALKAQRADAAKTKQLEDEHAAEVAKLKEQANARDVAIAAAPVTTTCAASPAMRALFDGLRARPAAAGPGQ